MASIHYKTGKDHKKTYYVVLSRHGRKKWVRAGTLKNARILAREIEGMQESERVEKLGLVPQTKRIDYFLQEYIDYVRVRTSPNTVKRYRAALNAFVAFLELYYPKLTYLSQIKQDHIEAFQQKRLESVELKMRADGDKPGNHKKKRLPLPQTVNYEVGVLRSAFVWANDRELIPTVPTRKVKPLKPKPKRKIRILDETECQSLLSAGQKLADSDSRLEVYLKAIAFIVNSGLRSGELCNLTWEDLDVETGLIKIQAKEGWTPKTFEREFYLNQACQKVLSSLDQDSDYVFVSLSGKELFSDDLRRALIKFAEAAGFSDLTRVHDLRHTFASLMQMNGVDAPTVARILGHRELQTTMIYTHQTADHLRKSIEKVGIGLYEYHCPHKRHSIMCR